MYEHKQLVGTITIKDSPPPKTPEDAAKRLLCVKWVARLGKIREQNERVWRKVIDERLFDKPRNRIVLP